MHRPQLAPKRIQHQPEALQRRRAKERVVTRLADDNEGVAAAAVTDYRVPLTRLA